MNNKNGILVRHFNFKQITENDKLKQLNKLKSLNENYQ